MATQTGLHIYQLVKSWTSYLSNGEASETEEFHIKKLISIVARENNEGDEAIYQKWI